jgi:DNA polymerase I-like protein with 3'-5' exonuclease and polymerase domains
MYQLPFAAMLPQSNWVAPRVSDLPRWDDCTRVGLDCETSDPDLFTLGCGVRRDGRLIGVSFALEDGPGFYLPFGHEGEGNLDKGHCIQYLKDQAKNFKGIIGGANLGYDLDYLAEDQVIFKPKKFRDIQVAEPILNEHRLKYSLEAQAGIYNIPGKDESLLKEAAAVFQAHPKKELWKLPPRFVGGYAEQDAHLPLQILRKQERLLEDQDLWDIYDLESDLLPVLIKMRRRGVQVDQNRLAQITRHIVKMEQEMCDEINRHSMVHIAPSDLKKASALGPLLRSLGYEPPKTEKTGKDSITKDYLASLDHPVARMVNEARAFATMESFCNGMPKYITRDGRVHSTFNQLKSDRADGKSTKGTVSGRLSATHKNIQQEPVRHPTLGALWRGIYKPDYGQWVSSDYSQQEPRLTIHYAELVGLAGAKEAGDRYRANPDEDSHQMMADLTGLDRKTAKNLFLGMCYSMGGAKFCRETGLPTEKKKINGRWMEVAGVEGQSLINQFNDTVPFVRALARECEKKAAVKGLIRTLLGRAIHFPVDDLGNFDWTHKALNRLIQGGSADQMKKAMVLADRAGIRIQLQVHDELDFSARTKEEANHLADIMRDAVPLLVPSKVDLEMGPSWGEIDEKGRAQCQEFYTA